MVSPSESRTSHAPSRATSAPHAPLGRLQPRCASSSGGRTSATDGSRLTRSRLPRGFLRAHLAARAGPHYPSAPPPPAYTREPLKRLHLCLPLLLRPGSHLSRQAPADRTQARTVTWPPPPAPPRPNAPRFCHLHPRCASSSGGSTPATHQWFTHPSPANSVWGLLRPAASRRTRSRLPPPSRADACHPSLVHRHNGAAPGSVVSTPTLAVPRTCAGTRRLAPASPAQGRPSTGPPGHTEYAQCTPGPGHDVHPSAVVSVLPPPVSL